MTERYIYKNVHPYVCMSRAAARAAPRPRARVQCSSRVSLFPSLFSLRCVGQWAGLPSRLLSEPLHNVASKASPRATEPPTHTHSSSHPTPARRATAQMLSDGPPPAKPPAVPGRQKILAVSIIFDVASVLLTIQFCALHCTSYSAKCTWVSGALVDWSGAVSCVCWFGGFALLVDWLVFDTFGAWGPSRRARP